MCIYALSFRLLCWRNIFMWKCLAASQLLTTEPVSKIVFHEIKDFSPRPSYTFFIENFMECPVYLLWTKEKRNGKPPRNMSQLYKPGINIVLAFLIYGLTRCVFSVIKLFMSSLVTSSLIPNSHCCLFCEGKKVKIQRVVIVLSPLLNWPGVVVIDACYNNKAQETITQLNGRRIKFIFRFRSVLHYDTNWGTNSVNFVTKPANESRWEQLEVGKHCDLRHN